MFAGRVDSTQWMPQPCATASAKLSAHVPSVSWGGKAAPGAAWLRRRRGQQPRPGFSALGRGSAKLGGGAVRGPGWSDPGHSRARVSCSLPTPSVSREVRATPVHVTWPASFAAWTGFPLSGVLTLFLVYLFPYFFNF